MHKIVPIVEGDGEVEAVPVLLRRILARAGRWDVQVARPKNAHGVGNLATAEGIEKFIRYAVIHPECSAVLVMRDNDNGCAMRLARSLAGYARRAAPRVPVAVVCPTREYEAWFLASLETIAGSPLEERRGLSETARYNGDVERPRDVKRWLTRHMPEGRAYKETEDQASMSALLDIDLAMRRSRSFRRLVRAVEDLLSGIDTGQSGVTPRPPDPPA